MKLRWPRRVYGERIGLAINGELSAVPSRFEPAVYGSEVRPIIDFDAGRIYAALNPIIATDLHGALAGHPQLEPAAKLAVHVRAKVSLGVELYGGFGPIDDLGSEHVTRLFGVVDASGSWWDVNLGGGYSWGEMDHAVAKVIFGMHPRH
jgi:hypothetical protein